MSARVLKAPGKQHTTRLPKVARRIVLCENRAFRSAFNKHRDVRWNEAVIKTYSRAVRGTLSRPIFRLSLNCTGLLPTAMISSRYDRRLNEVN